MKNNKTQSDSAIRIGKKLELTRRTISKSWCIQGDSSVAKNVLFQKRHKNTIKKDR